MRRSQRTFVVGGSLVSSWPMDNPFLIGVTGGIGSGKSAFCDMFRNIDIPVFNADLEARALMNDSKDVRRAIIEEFGPASYIDGVLDRKFIADIVFNDKERLNALNAIALPPLWKRLRKWCASQKTSYVLMESATLIDHGGQEHVDYVVVVTAPRELRIERAMKRDGATREQVEARINSQMPEEERLSFAQTIIHNDGDIDNLLRQAVELEKRLTSIL